MTQADLIMALKTARKGSQALDDRIAKQIGWKHSGWWYDQLPHWTQSYDAARTLIPNGWTWELKHFWNHPWAIQYFFCLHSPRNEPPIEVYAMTETLAVCAAALQTR